MAPQTMPNATECPITCFNGRRCVGRSSAAVKNMTCGVFRIKTSLRLKPTLRIGTMACGVSTGSSGVLAANSDAPPQAWIAYIVLGSTDSTYDAWGTRAGYDRG